MKEITSKLPEKIGGGGRSRTYDAADMSRVDSESNLLEILTKLLLEADAGGNSDDPEALQ